MNAAQLGKLLQRLTHDTRSEYSQAETAVADIRGQQLSLKQQINSHYQQMANLLLKESPASHEFHTIQLSLDRLRQEIARTTQALREQEQAFERLQAQQTTLIEQAQTLTEQRDSQLAANKEAVQARTSMQQNRAELERATARHQELTAEVSTKRLEFERQRIFMFLYKKGYGKAGSRTWPVMRNLDGWLASLVRFKENVARYEMLEALQHTSTQRLQSLQQQSETRTALFENFVTGTEQALKLPEVNQQIKAVESRLTASRHLIRQLQDNIQQYARGEGEAFGRIEQQVTEQMSKLPVEKLNVLVNKTATQQDDLLLAELRTLLREETNLNLVLEQKQQAAKIAQTRVNAADALESLYIREEYNHPRLEYNWGWFERPESFFTRYLCGEISLQEVNHKLTAISRWIPLPSRTPARSTGSSWGSSTGSIWGGLSTSSGSRGGQLPSSSGSSRASSTPGNGGFSTSSSSGGGGFRTTDSF